METVLIGLLTGVGRAVVERYLTADKAKQLTMFAFDILERGTAVNARLQAYADYVDLQISMAKAEGVVWQPSKDDFKDIWEKINSRDEEWSGV